MTWVAVGTTVVTAAAGAYAADKAGDKAAKASKSAAKTAADAQMASLDYLKEREALPQQYREAALGQLASIYGLDPADGPALASGGNNPLFKRTPKIRQEVGGADSFISGLKDNPLYQAILGTRQAGESAILRNASATGGLRSGNANANLTDYSQQLENKALLDTYNQQVAGLTGLANLPSYAPQIAATTAGIGNTLAQGQIGAAQAQLIGQQNAMNNIMGVANLGLQAYQAYKQPYV